VSTIPNATALVSLAIDTPARRLLLFRLSLFCLVSCRLSFRNFLPFRTPAPLPVGQELSDALREKRRDDIRKSERQERHPACGLLSTRKAPFWWPRWVAGGSRPPSPQGLTLIRDTARQTAYSRILIDASTLSPPRADFYRFLAGQDLAALCPLPLKVVVVCQEQWMTKFAENVAVNRGAKLLTRFPAKTLTQSTVYRANRPGSRQVSESARHRRRDGWSARAQRHT
jgi:hypothetical protein